MYRNTSPGIIITLVWKDVRGVHVFVGGVGVEREAHPILWKCWNSRRSDSQLNKHQSSSTLPPPTLRSRTPCTSYSTLIPQSERNTEKKWETREWETERKRDLYCHHCLSVIAMGLGGKADRPKSRERPLSLQMCTVPYKPVGCFRWGSAQGRIWLKKKKKQPLARTPVRMEKLIDPITFLW